MDIGGGSFSTKKAMANWKYFHIESKSFDLITEAGNIGLCIIERGKNYLSNITMGREGADWFKSLMAEAANTSPDKHLLKTFREANKVFVIQKQHNERGRFILMKEFGVSKNKGYIVIPEGKDVGMARL